MSESLALYGYWRSMAAYRVRVALALKGVTVREVAIDLDAGEQFAPDFLAVNPEGAVPALVEPGHAPISQSMAILEYLEERYPEPALLPMDLHGRARVRSLAALIASDTHPLLVPRVTAYLSREAGLEEPAVRAWSLHWVMRGLAVAEARLANDPATGAFCHGDRVSFADICLANLGIVAKAAARADLASFPTVARIVGRCETMDAFVAAEPRRQLNAPGQRAAST
jgi:maleylacetoacetate isomerase/maleylpyruvate isomerase